MALNGNSACHWNVPNNFTGFTAQNTYSLWIFRLPNRSGYIYYLLEKFPLNFSSDINNAWISTSSSANNSCRNKNKYQGKILITWRQRRRFCTHRREQLWINLRHASAIAVDVLAPAPFALLTSSYSYSWYCCYRCLSLGRWKSVFGRFRVRSFLAVVVTFTAGAAAAVLWIFKTQRLL